MWHLKILVTYLLSKAFYELVAAACGAQYVAYPTSEWASSGWVSRDIGAGNRRQGHITGVIKSDADLLVSWGGTALRTDDVTDVLGREANVSVFDTAALKQNWTTLTMIAYDGAPPALFRPGSFVWRKSIFIVGGHTDVPYTTTSNIWRADIAAFEEASEGLWRPVNATVGNGSITEDVIPPGRYGHTATVMDTGESDPAQVWVAVIGGMLENQEGVDGNYILRVADTGEVFECDDADLPASSLHSCAQRKHTRPTDSQGEWWSLEARLSPTSSSGPAQRSYHAAASIPSDGRGNTSCVFVFSGWDYANSKMFDDMWRLCPSSGYLGSSAKTTFVWTELTPMGNAAKGRYGATFTSGMDDGLYRMLLYGGTGRYPNSYMDDTFAHEYDTYMDAWVEATLANSSGTTPGGRRDHTLEIIRDMIILVAGIDNDDQVLKDTWTVNFSSPVCAEGEYMRFCDDTATAVCGICPNGTAALRASYACQACMSGTFAGEGASVCTPCPSGTYGTGDGKETEAAACQACPAGTAVDTNGTSSVEGCIDCPAGTFSLAGVSVCSPCPSGFYSSLGASTCLPCPAGTFRDTLSSSGDCDVCPAGTYAPFEQSEACLDCPEGFYSVEGGATTCVPCPVGTAGSRVAGGDLLNACPDCPKGTFSEVQGGSSCEPCPAGTASSTSGGSVAGVCKTCSNGSFALSGSSSCESCTAGSYSMLAGAESCESCPVGTYLTSTGATSVDDCIHCPQGYSTSLSGSNSSLECVQCPPGTHSVTLEDGGGCQACPRGEHTSTFEEAEALNCTQCLGGYYANELGTITCSFCEEHYLSFNGHAACSTCETNTTCPLGPNGEYCSGFGTCFLGVCVCSDGFTGIDCSNGTCDGCGGSVGFAFDSTATTHLESDGSISLGLVRLAGTDGDMTVTVDVVGGNVTEGVDYDGTWPIEVNFSSGQSEVAIVVSVNQDNEPDEGCQALVLGVTNVTAGNGSTIVEAGINDVSSEAVVAIEEVDFSSAVLEAVLPEDGRDGAGGLSPASAKVILANTSATWASNIMLSMVGTTPANRSLALPLDIFFVVEINASTSATLGRFAALLPGLAAKMQANLSSPAFGIATFASDYYRVIQPLTTRAYQVTTAMDEIAGSSRSNITGYSGSQWLALYNCAEEDAVAANNATGWRNGTFRVAAMVTGSSFSASPGFDPLDASTWIPRDDVTLSALASQLYASAVHPIFLVTDETLEQQYQSLVQELKFGATVAINEENALAKNYNDDYLPRGFFDGLEVLYAQTTLFITSDEGGFVSSIIPAVDASRNVTAGSEIKFEVNMSATPASAVRGGHIMLCFQGHQSVVTVVRERQACAVEPLSRSSGADIATLDSRRAGWAQAFYPDEMSRWVFSSAFYSIDEDTGPFGVSARLLSISCPDMCSNEEAYIDLTLAFDSEMPLVLKAYFSPSIASTTTIAASASLNVTYADGLSDNGISVLDFSEAPVETWTQNILAFYPTKVIKSAKIVLSFSGKGKASFAGVGLFAHPDAACRCDGAYYLDISSASARICTPQPECTFFEGDCTYCPAGYKCPQGGVLMACPRGTYSMGGYTDCLPCPAGWLCQEGLAVPCGYGTTYTSVSTGAQDEEGFSTSETDIYGGVCVSCPPGGQCPGGGVWEECPPGTFSSGGDASIVCQLCSPGTFANRTAMVECQSCAAGLTSNFGAVECHECPPGAYSEEGQHPCKSCPPGTYAEGASSECTPCPFGYYASEKAMFACEQCPSATNTTSEGSLSADYCV